MNSMRVYHSTVVGSLAFAISAAMLRRLLIPNSNSSSNLRVLRQEVEYCYQGVAGACTWWHGIENSDRRAKRLNSVSTGKLSSPDLTTKGTRERALVRRHGCLAIWGTRHECRQTAIIVGTKVISECMRSSFRMRNSGRPCFSQQ